MKSLFYHPTYVSSLRTTKEETLLICSLVSSLSSSSTPNPFTGLKVLISEIHALRSPQFSEHTHTHTHPPTHTHSHTPTHTPTKGRFKRRWYNRELLGCPTCWLNWSFSSQAIYRPKATPIRLTVFCTRK